MFVGNLFNGFPDFRMEITKQLGYEKGSIALKVVTNKSDVENQQSAYVDWVLTRSTADEKVAVFADCLIGATAMGHKTVQTKLINTGMIHLLAPEQITKLANKAASQGDVGLMRQIIQHPNFTFEALSVAQKTMNIFGQTNKFSSFPAEFPGIIGNLLSADTDNPTLLAQASLKGWYESLRRAHFTDLAEYSQLIDWDAIEDMAFQNGDMQALGHLAIAYMEIHGFRERGAKFYLRAVNNGFSSLLPIIEGHDSFDPSFIKDVYQKAVKAKNQTVIRRFILDLGLSAVLVEYSNVKVGFALGNGRWVY